MLILASLYSVNLMFCLRWYKYKVLIMHALLVFISEEFMIIPLLSRISKFDTPVVYAN